MHMLNKRLLRPRSFPVLILAGFVVVAIPLLGGMLRISYLLEEITKEGQRSVTLSAEVTLLSRQLSEAGRHLKRTAGQYFVLEDPALKQRLDNAHLHFSDILEQLSNLPWAPDHQPILTRLSKLEQDLYSRMRGVDKADAEHFEHFKDDFDELSLALAAISEQTAMLVQQQVAIINGRADRMRQEMFWQAAALVLLSVFLAAFLSWLISRPVQQLSERIRRLGKSDLSFQGQIRGPKDMVYLGEQLDWLRKRLQELEASKLAFFREVSHELKTPLTILLEAVSLLSDKVVGELTEQQEEIIGIMLKSTENLRQRIEDLLSYNEALRQSDNSHGRFLLKDLINDITSRLDLLFRSKQLQLSVSITDIELFADKGGLAMALENLLSNAVKFSPEGGVIEMTAGVVADKLSIRVCDQGPGIPQSDISKLFQPFYKGGSSANTQRSSVRKLKNSGLGLAIARTHIEGQGGQLDLVSAPEWGACFQITLPLREEERVCNVQ